MFIARVEMRAFCSVFWSALVIAFLLLVGSTFGQGTGAGQNQGSIGQSPDAMNSQQNFQQQVIKRYFAELDLLIPGEFAADSPERAVVEKAVTAFAKGDSPEATRQLQKLATSPNFPPLGLLQAGLVFASGNPTQGFKILESAAQNHPDYPGIYLAFSRLAISQQRITDAQALIEKAERKLASRPENGVESTHFKKQIYEVWIDIAMRLKKFEIVKDNLGKLAVVDPESTRVAITRAELDFIAGKFDSSFKRLKEFHAENPGSNLPEIVMARWSQNTGNQKATGEWVSKAATNYPDNPAVQLQYANFALNQSQFPSATSAVEKIEGKVGETPETILLKGKIAFASQAYDVAEGHYKKLFETQPKNFDAANMYALSLVESDSEDKQRLALQITQRNFQSLQDNQIAQAAFGWVLWKTGKKDQAKTLLTRAARSPQLAPEIAYFLATMMHELGTSQRARLVLEPALKQTGLFLYRNSANQLMAKIDSSSTGTLPSPSNGK